MKFCEKHNINHNDIKPENILYKIEENQKLTVKITDFGQVNKCGGTPGFASPENFDRPILSTSDTWSFGKTLLYLYTTEEIYKYLTQIPIIPGQIIDSLQNRTDSMLKNLSELIDRHPIIEMTKNMLRLGQFQETHIKPILQKSIPKLTMSIS